MINYSIIIPHKNCPELLKRCIDSIPEREDVQIIIVDDNSDADKKPSSKRENVEVVLLDSDQAKGAGRARNVGLELAKGKWLLFADADDYYNSGFLGVLDKYVNSNYDVVYFNFDFKDGKTGEDLPALRFKKYFDDYNGSRESRDQIKFHHNVPWTKMVCNDYVKQHSFLFEETLNGNDIMFSMMLGYFTDNIAVEKSPLYVYIRNTNSLVTKKYSNASALCKLTHTIQQNRFYDFIGHSEWEKPAIQTFFYFLKKLGGSFAFYFAHNSWNIYVNRKAWISLCLKSKDS